MAPPVGIRLTQCAAADAPTPSTGQIFLFLDSADGKLKYKDSSAVLHIANAGDALVANPLSQFAATTSAQLAGVISNETGSGALVFGTAPALSAPTGIVELDIGASTHDYGNTSTALTVDWSLATQGKCTATGSATITHSNMVAGKVYTLEYYTGAGSFTTTFASTNFAGGTAPTLTVTASKVDIFTFVKVASGTIMGSIYGQSFAP